MYVCPTCGAEKERRVSDRRVASLVERRVGSERRGAAAPTVEPVAADGTPYETPAAE